MLPRCPAGVYSKTVNLPQTGFDMRANSVVREPQLQKFWEENKIYEKLSRENQGVGQGGWDGGGWGHRGCGLWGSPNTWAGLGGKEGRCACHGVLGTEDREGVQLAWPASAGATRPLGG